jgi:hypothetical protein
MKPYLIPRLGGPARKSIIGDGKGNLDTPKYNRRLDVLHMRRRIHACYMSSIPPNTTGGWMSCVRASVP